MLEAERIWQSIQSFVGRHMDGYVISLPVLRGSSRISNITYSICVFVSPVDVVAHNPNPMIERPVAWVECDFNGEAVRSASLVWRDCGVRDFSIFSKDDYFPAYMLRGYFWDIVPKVLQKLDISRERFINGDRYAVEEYNRYVLGVVDVGYDLLYRHLMNGGECCSEEA